MRIRTFVATASLVASGGLVALAGPAQAALQTTCVGEGGAVTVRDNLVVPAGSSCTLTGTKVRGTVTVEAGADLVASGATFSDDVIVGENAYVDLTDTVVKGALTAQAAFGAHLGSSSVDDGISATQGFIYTVDSTVGGSVSVAAGELYTSGSSVSGDLTGDGGLYTDVYDSTVEGALTVSGNEFGGVLCGSEVEGDTLYKNNSDVLQLGGDGPLSSCAEATYLGGDLTVTGNTATAVLDNAIVRGVLNATGNTPALQIGDLARVRGGITGETNASAALSARKAAAQNHAQALAEKAAQRAAEAQSKAAAAGKADL